MSPFPKKKPQAGLPQRPGLSAPSPVEKKAPPMPPDDESAEDPAEEAAESPAEEQSEDQSEGSGDIMKDLAAVGEKYGADPETSKALAADFLDALAKCLRGGQGEEQPMDDGGGEGDLGGGGGAYGR